MSEYEMSEEDLKVLLDSSKPVTYMVFGGMEPSSTQENANRAWKSLGKKMGFNSKTVKPSNKGQKFFTAESMEAQDVTH